MPRAKAQTAALLASPDDVEAQFYEALQQADLDKLMAVWADDDEIVCVHPGGPRVIGLPPSAPASRPSSPTARSRCGRKGAPAADAGLRRAPPGRARQRHRRRGQPQRPGCWPPTST